jgi:hypothetical protein
MAHGDDGHDCGNHTHRSGQHLQAGACHVAAQKRVPPRVHVQCVHMIHCRSRGRRVLHHQREDVQRSRDASVPHVALLFRTLQRAHARVQVSLREAEE